MADQSVLDYNSDYSSVDWSLGSDASGGATDSSSSGGDTTFSVTGTDYSLSDPSMTNWDWWDPTASNPGLVFDLPLDPASQAIADQFGLDKGFYYDPASGLAVDPVTGIVYDPANNWAVMPTGNSYGPLPSQTGPLTSVATIAKKVAADTSAKPTGSGGGGTGSGGAGSPQKPTTGSTTATAGTNNAMLIAVGILIWLATRKG